MSEPTPASDRALWWYFGGGAVGCIAASIGVVILQPDMSRGMFVALGMVATLLGNGIGAVVGTRRFKRSVR